MGYLRIGELARATGTSVETLRYYESEGLLQPPRRSASGYRQYSPDEASRVQFIRRARAMDFSLREISDLLSLQVDRASSTCGEVKALAEQKLDAIDRKLAELEKMKSALQRITDACEGGEAPASRCTILNALES